jgi:hypothetical protein
MELMELAKDFGPLVGIVLFFIWRDWRREEGLVERKNNATVIATNTAVIATNTEQLRLMNERLNG